MKEMLFLFPHAAVNILELSCWMLVHTCNPSYERGRDQEDHDSKPAPVV
jgi:hypothetical protein